MVLLNNGSVAFAVDQVNGRNVCVALEGTIGNPVTCTVHDRKPRECVRYRPGARCHKFRRLAGLEEGS